MHVEHKFTLMVITCSVSFPLWMRKLKLLMSVLGACVLWTYFLAFIMKEVKWRKLNSWEKVILMLSLITTPTLAAAVAAAFFCFGGRGGNEWLQINLFLSNLDHILFQRMKNNTSQQLLEAEGFPIWGEPGNFTGHFNPTAHLEY